MSVIPEIILQRAIMNGFTAIRKNPSIINVLFKNLPFAQQEAIKVYITETLFDMAINYPRAEIKAPLIVLLLKSESESNQFLGDVMGAAPNYEMFDTEMAEDESIGYAASTSNMQGLPQLITGGLHVQAMLPGKAAITFTDASQQQMNEVFSSRPEWPLMVLYVSSGAGQGKTYPISSITSSQLDIVGTFALDLDSTSVVDIRLYEDREAVYGNPVRTLKGSTSQLRVGANYDTQYQLDVLAGNQNEVIYLYTVLKAILFAQRAFLEAQGIMALKITGSDLTPRVENLPDEIFQRSMTLQFTYPFSLVIDQDVVNEIRLTLMSVDPSSATPVPGEQIEVSVIEVP